MAAAGQPRRFDKVFGSEVKDIPRTRSSQGEESCQLLHVCTPTSESTVRPTSRLPHMTTCCMRCTLPGDDSRSFWTASRPTRTIPGICLVEPSSAGSTSPCFVGRKHRRQIHSLSSSRVIGSIGPGRCSRLLSPMQLVRFVALVAPATACRLDATDSLGNEARPSSLVPGR